MYRFYLAAVDLLPGVLLLLPLYWILNKVYFCSARKSTLYCLFSCYIAVVYVLVGLPNVTYIRPEVNLNLIPVVGMIDDWKNCILNILLFVPLGAMLPVLWRKFRKLRYTVLLGFGMSLAIELLQILTFRATDVNDLITNTFGTYSGFLCARLLLQKSTRLRCLVDEENTGEFVIVLTAVLLPMFFVYPFLSAALWDWVLS